MKFLSVAGTIAMFLVGGGILAHGMPWLHHLGAAFAAWVGALPGAGRLLAVLAPTLANLVAGFLAGAVAVAVVTVVAKKAAGKPSIPTL
jgi:predicted DNA repair protein MutK